MGARLIIIRYCCGKHWARHPLLLGFESLPLSIENPSL